MGETDEELVARAVAARDAAAFEALVLRHQSRVRNWLRQLAGDASLADDLAQETFLRAWRCLSSFDGRGRFVSWLMRIGYHAYLEELRQRTRVRRLSDALRADGHDRASIADDAAAADVSRLLAVLTDDERVAMILGYAHGLSHGEIADITGMPLGTVKSHIRRGKIKIQERFELCDECG